jgi:pectate lyase-like protein
MGEKPIPSVPIWKNLKKDYGAHGDGIADDTAELARSIEDFPGTSPGALYLPEGTYRISEQIVIRKPYLVLRGDGPDKTKIAFTRGICTSSMARRN